MEPFGGPFDDYRAAIGAACTVNVHRKKESPPVAPLDLLPWHAPNEPVPELTPEQIAANIRSQVFGLKD